MTVIDARGLRKAFGTTIAVDGFDSTVRAWSKGMVTTPSIADLFVAVMGNTAGETQGAAR